MDFIEASEYAKKGHRVRRKSWADGKANAWPKNIKEKRREMWWDEKYQCLLAGAPDKHLDEDTYLDTEGWIYICRGDDVEATDWEVCE